MLFKTKLFSSQFVVERVEGGSWETLNKTEDVDTQINEWVDETGSTIVSTSSPSIHAEWLDSEKKRKTIIVSVMVIYTPEGEENVGSYPELRDPTDFS